MEDVSEEPLIIKYEMKLSLFLPIIAGFFIILYVMLHFTSLKINIALILIISIFVIIIDIFSIYLARQHKTVLNNDSIALHMPFRKVTTVYYDSISKIAYKKATACFMIYEKPDTPSVTINARIYSTKDIKVVLNRIIARKPKIRLDEETKNYLKK